MAYELQDIASNPDETFVLTAANFDLLLQKERPLINSICKNEQTTEGATCPEASADIVFMVDGSGSVGSKNFESFKIWMKKIIDHFRVGESYIRVGIVQYTTEATIEYNLSDKQESQSILAAIDNIKVRGGGTKTGGAIDFIVNDVFDDETASSNKVLIVLTDGKSQDEVKQFADAAKDEHGISMFAVGVADANSEELKNLASSEELVWQGEPYDRVTVVRLTGLSNNIRVIIIWPKLTESSNSAIFHAKTHWWQKITITKMKIRRTSFLNHPIVFKNFI